MKLGALVFAVLALAGCASTCPQAVPVTSTTQLTSVELSDTEFAPLVGKSHASNAALTDDDQAEPKDARRHSGSGFSGYK